MSVRRENLLVSADNWTHIQSEEHTTQIRKWNSSKFNEVGGRFSVFIRDYRVRSLRSSMWSPLKMTASLSQMSEVLELRHRLHRLTKEYNGVEGFLGERFCEIEFQMQRTPRGTKDIDGYIQDKSVQVKFKWVSADNLKTRYVAIKPEAQFDWLAVVCAEEGGSEVRLFGIWENPEVLDLTRKSNSNRVMLKDLSMIPQVAGLKIDPKLLYR